MENLKERAAPEADKGRHGKDADVLQKTCSAPCRIGHTGGVATEGIVLPSRRDDASKQSNYERETELGALEPI